MGPLCAPPPSLVADANEIVDGRVLAATKRRRRHQNARPPENVTDDDAPDAFGDHTAVHDEAWEAAWREMQMTMKASQG